MVIKTHIGTIIKEISISSPIRVKINARRLNAATPILKYKSLENMKSDHSLVSPGLAKGGMVVFPHTANWRLRSLCTMNGVSPRPSRTPDCKWR